MAKIKYCGNMGTPPAVTIAKKSGVTYKAGAFLASDGGIAAAVPSLIAVGVTDSEVICNRVRKDDIFETTLSAAGTDLDVGDKVTLSADGTKVTATTTAGYAEIIKLFGTAEGSKVLIKF